MRQLAWRAVMVAVMLATALSCARAGDQDGRAGTADELVVVGSSDDDNKATDVGLEIVPTTHDSGRLEGRVVVRPLVEVSRVELSMAGEGVVHLEGPTERQTVTPELGSRSAFEWSATVRDEGRGALTARATAARDDGAATTRELALYVVVLDGTVYAGTTSPDDVERRSLEHRKEQEEISEEEYREERDRLGSE